MLPTANMINDRNGVDRQDVVVLEDIGDDNVDYVNRKPVKLLSDEANSICDDSLPVTNKSIKADIIDCIFILISIITYLVDIATDVLLAIKIYSKSEWVWFGLVVFFIVVPSLVLQLLSAKWHFDDNDSQPWFSTCLHILQGGPLERYCRTFWYGLRTILSSNTVGNKKAIKRNYEVYLSSWRDMCMLRFLESFLEGAPQVTIQFYIISQISYQRSMENWLHIASLVISMVSLAWSIVTYTYVLRLSGMKTSYSICGYIFQIFYRVFMVSSRIAALLVFLTNYKWLVIVILCIHWLLMIYFLNSVNSQFCIGADGNTQYCFEHLFTCIMGFVYIFCFINTKEGATRVRITIYYVLFISENSVMVSMWVYSRGHIGIIEYAVMTLVWGGFLLGVVSMVLYYRFFHPYRDAIGGWFHCHCCKENIDVTATKRHNTLQESASRELYRRLQSNIISEKVYVDVEFPARKMLRSTIDDVAIERNGNARPISLSRINDIKCHSSVSTRQNSLKSLYSHHQVPHSLKDFDYSGIVTSFI